MADISVMQEKWRNFFKLLDIDKDGKVTSKDKDACIEAFGKLPSQNVGSLKNNLELFWTKVMFLDSSPNWSKEMSEDEFVKMMCESFNKDKDKLKDTIKAALKHLIDAADFDKNNIFTFDKFFQFHVAFNIPVEIVVKTTFNVIGPSSDDTCSFDDVYNFYVELFIGEDVAKFEAFKNAYKAVGLL